MLTGTVDKLSENGTFPLATAAVTTPGTGDTFASAFASCDAPAFVPLAGRSSTIITLR